LHNIIHQSHAAHKAVSETNVTTKRERHQLKKLHN